ncbi:MAG TPA: metalloregulator ArsR/SmtB family transcription factor [Mycobacteriales bacterium]|jgi:DNA-binding transcriptional ArsR family regulator|nr:metalloregulator ArsR/SmtB family transcription factor [Mycobacteriales bacterium]
MLNQAEPLDRVFQALADATRRELVARLICGPASVSELAGPLSMSLPAVMQHLAVLESCGLVSSQKVGRVRTCQLEPTAMSAAEDWIGRQRLVWERRLDRLGDVLAESAESPETRELPTERTTR